MYAETGKNNKRQTTNTDLEGLNPQQIGTKINAWNTVHRSGRNCKRVHQPRQLHWLEPLQHGFSVGEHTLPEQLSSYERQAA
jgi:hypothetical protein